MLVFGCASWDCDSGGGGLTLCFLWYLFVVNSRVDAGNPDGCGDFGAIGSMYGTLLETKVALENRPAPKRKPGSSSNHPFSSLVSGKAISTYIWLISLWQKMQINISWMDFIRGGNQVLVGNGRTWLWYLKKGRMHSRPMSPNVFFWWGKNNGSTPQ